MIDYAPLTLREIQTKFDAYVEKGDLRSLWETLRVTNEQRSIRPVYDSVNPLSIMMIPAAVVCLLIAIALPKNDTLFRVIALAMLATASALRVYWWLRENKSKQNLNYRIELDKIALKTLVQITEGQKFKPQPLHKEQHHILSDLLSRVQASPPTLLNLLELNEQAVKTP